jgi:hypothetical protein
MRSSKLVFDDVQLMTVFEPEIKMGPYTGSRYDKT